MSFDLNILEHVASKQVQLIDQQNGTVIELQCKGGLLNHWMVKNGGQSQAVILGNSGIEDFEMNGFRSGKMGPFSCRVDGGKYQIGHQTYIFNKFYLGPHAIHGLIYDAEFTILSTKINAQSAEVLFSFAYKGTDPGYPFPFDIQLQWTLYTDNLIGIKTTIVNQSNNTIPYMDGWHPYFTLGGQVDDYLLEFKSNAKLEMRDDMIPSGIIRQENNFEKGKKIGNTHLDDCFILDPIKNKIKISYAGNSITVIPIQNYPYLQLYTPGDRKSIAIENLSGAPDCFNNKMGLQLLEPQGQICFETRYHFETT